LKSLSGETGEIVNSWRDCQLSARFERASAKKSQPKFKMMNLQINDPDKLDDTYNLTSAIKMMKTNHIKYNLHNVFNIIFPDATDPYKVVKIVDLYTNYGSITASKVAKSNCFYATMLRDPHGSIHENLSVTQEYLINNADDDLYGVAANMVKYAHKLIKQIPMNIVHVKGRVG
jgi:hypothetical protein